MYRLWGLPPLQSQLVRRGEAVLEVWARPARGVRQAVIRVTLRRDGKAFVQARAGLGCCEPAIARRIAFDEDLAPEKASAVRALIDDPMWQAPRFVVTEEAGGGAAPVCVDGVSWDVTLVTPGASRHLRRACLDEEAGSIAPALQAALDAAQGLEPRLDVIFPRGADQTVARKAYEDLLARGGRLRAAPGDRPQAPAVPTVSPEAVDPTGGDADDAPAPRPATPPEPSAG